MGELVRIPTRHVHKQQIVHLGAEHDGFSLRNADLLLRSDHTITIEGRGTSMEPIIPDGSRMVIAPWKNSRPKKGDILFCRIYTPTFRGYSIHMCWWVTRRKFLMIDTEGNVHGYVPFKHIMGEYLGIWDSEKRDIIPYRRGN